MFIQTEDTPNPAALKFLPGREVLPEGVADFTSREAAARSPLARLLFEIDGVAGVFLGSDFVTVTKDGDRTWQTLKPMVLGAIMDHFTSGAAVLEGEQAVEEEIGSDASDEIVATIEKLHGMVGKGMLSQAEFDAKKAELLKKLG